MHAVRCGVIFSDSTITNFLLILTVQKSLKTGQYLMVMRISKNVPNLLEPPCVVTGRIQEFAKGEGRCLTFLSSPLPLSLTFLPPFPFRISAP